MKNEKLKLKNLGKNKFCLATKFAYHNFPLFNFPFALVSKMGFTLLETVVALAILSAAIVGPMSLVSRGIAGARTSKNRVIASYLAQEGMEVVRLIKENNALAGFTDNSAPCDSTAPFDPKWNSGICPGVWQAYINDDQTENSGFVLKSDTGSSLLFDAGQPGLYNHRFGDPTIFTRTVEISAPVGPEDDTVSDFSIPPEDILDVVVTVSWREGVSMREVELLERFYNWQ